MNNEQKVLNLLGLARRAGKLEAGEDMALKAIRNGKASLVFFANDGGASSAKKFTDKTTSYDVPLCTKFSKAQLADATGMPRTVIAVVNRGFAKKMQEYLE
ncbi:ribosomal protein L7Ae-like RNA K-turn-binding protein [Weissella uvarum]|uniref:YlxQ-related RNA-binding protein n=1 Tax=Weissella uvarum TaxID=1479233 RepID=UPI001960C15B|nr:YlxQ-related RNA-binding protein [Weissella uvarum]MBM7617574.1 ribosomal protein L7Ae-like RNA K-turn-binding protein [Weissella uvarum]MCM0595544.1 YlxQ-related RNA-binding protein [Weissella uvarum]